MKLSEAIAKVEEVVEIKKLVAEEGQAGRTTDGRETVWFNFFGSFQARMVGGSFALIQADEGYEPNEMYGNYDVPPERAGERAFNLVWDGSEFVQNSEPDDTD